MKYDWVQDVFDTEIFGFPIAKITHITVLESLDEQKKVVEELVEDLVNKKVKYASYRVRASEFSVIHALEESEFFLVDGLLSLERPIAKEGGKTSLIRPASKKDSLRLQQIAGDSFTSNRFYHDKVFKNYKEKIHSFYAKWIDNSLHGKVADSVLVWEEEKEIVGFISLQKNGHIPLVAVSEKARGRGIARKLISSSFDIFSKWGVKTAKIETVMTNIPAIRTYQSCGFTVVDSFLTLRWHKNV